MDLTTEIIFPEIKIVKIPNINTGEVILELKPIVHNYIESNYTLLIYTVRVYIKDFIDAIKNKFSVLENLSARYCIFVKDIRIFDSDTYLTPLSKLDTGTLMINSIYKELGKWDSTTININGKTISVPIEYKNVYDWPYYNILLSKELLQYVLTGDYNIKYMDNIHINLYKRSIQFSIIQIMQVTLIKMDLIDHENRVTDLGKSVLDRLSSTIPINYATYHKQILNILLNDFVIIDNPLKQYLVDNDYFKKDTGITNRGRRWLADNHMPLYKKCGKNLQTKLIPFIDKKDLTPYLTSDEKRIREAAKRVFQKGVV